MSCFQRLMLVIVSFAFSACSQNSVIESAETATPYTAGTETAQAFPSSIPLSATPMSLPTISFANTALPTFTPLPLPGTAVVQPTPGTMPQGPPSELTFDQINPIFYGKSLLGATFGGNWFYPREVYSLLGNPQVYDFYDQNFQPFQATAVVSEPPPGGAYQCGWLGVKFVDQEIDSVSPVLGVKPGQSVIFRPVQNIAQDSGLYEQYLQEWLLLQGVQSPELGIKNILLVDLEGDAVDEVILVATNISDSMGDLHMAGAGKYSVVLMRKVIGAQVYTVPLVADIYYNTPPLMNYPIIYDVDHIYDLNGDGKLEIILSGQWWEGGGLFVHEVHGLNVPRVLDLHCGIFVRR